MSQNEATFSRLDASPSLSAYARAAAELKNFHGPELRLAILSNHTFDIGATLTVESIRRGFRPVLHIGGYDQYRQELLDPASPLAAFHPDAILISLDFETSAPGDGWIAAYRDLLAAWRNRSATPLFLLNFLPPPADGFDRAMELNLALRGMARSLSSVFVIDLARLACASNLPDWRDRRLWYLAKVGVNPKKFPPLAARIARTLAALRRPAAKCLAFDLDNTVWGGVAGEVGAGAVHCSGGQYPGAAFADFQRALLALRARGVLLAVASKNDRALVDQVFREHPDMPLRPEHIAHWEVHWEPKPVSLRRIAEALNIGLDSIVFLDDNPAEVELVSQILPAVRALRAPDRPEDYAPFLDTIEDFDQLEISSEDLRRSELYDLRKKQTGLAAAAIDLESFYRSLRTVLVPEPAAASNLDRIVQLIGKTNQFNLTTRRHGKTYLLERIERGAEVWAFRARDVHGDHGLIAVVLLEFAPPDCIVDTFLMSCRVIGRTLESAILHFCQHRAAERGAHRMVGEYLPTDRNSPCRDFYSAHGFAALNEARWATSLDRAPSACPEWISIEGSPHWHATGAD